MGADSFKADPQTFNASGGRSRALEMEGLWSHTSSNTVTGLRYRAEISMCGVTVWIGDCRQWNPIGKKYGTAIVEAEGQVFTRFKIPLTRDQLVAIEQHRKGGDVQVTMRGEVDYGIAHQIPGQGHWTMGETRFMHIKNDWNTEWKQSIPQSQWVQMLGDWSWSDLDLVEIPRVMQGDTAALRHLEAARSLLSKGEWAECLGRCYNALEAAMGKDKKTAAERWGRHLGEDAVKKLNALMLAANQFSQEGRHHGEGIHAVGQHEANMMVLITAGLLSFMV